MFSCLPDDKIMVSWLTFEYTGLGHQTNPTGEDSILRWKFLILYLKTRPTNQFTAFFWSVRTTLRQVQSQRN